MKKRNGSSGKNSERTSRTAHIPIWGLHPVEECIKVRPSACIALFTLPSFGRKRNQLALESLAKNSGIEIHRAHDFRKLKLPQGAVHQGVAAIIKPFWQAKLSQITADALEYRKPVLICDQISDPRNLGAVIRAAAAFNAAGIVISHRHTSGITGSVVKASAGTIFHVKIAQVSNIQNALKSIKKEGIWIFALDSRGAMDLTQADLSSGPLAFVTGAEGKGLRKNIRNEADLLVKIPMKSNIESLNVSCAVSVALYECMRQKAGALN